MADGLIIENKENPADKAGAPKGAPTTSTATGSNIALSMSALLNKVGRQSKLSEAGTKYIAELTKMLKEELGTGVEVNNIPDTVLNAVCVTYNKNSVMLTFSETYLVPKDTCIPPTDQIGPAAKYIHDTFGGSLLNNIVVTAGDYALVDKMAMHLSRMLRIRSGAIPDLTIENLQNGKFTISTNIADVRAAIKMLNPKVVQPRTDGGVVLYINEEFGHQGPGGQVHQPEPILVLGGFTNFISAANSPGSYQLNNNTPTFLSLVSITSILSPFMTPEMLALAIPLATEYFISTNGWLTPYTKFGKKDPNLGSLIPDDKNKPCFIENITELYAFVQKHIQPPAISFDVMDGQARIPGLENLRYDDRQVQAHIAKFLCMDPNTTVMDTMVLERYMEYTGEINGTEDSRSVDYLTLVASGVDDMNTLLRYLYIGTEPQTRASLISSISNMETLYTNCRVVLTPTYVDWLTDCVTARFRPLWENNNMPENNLGALGNGQGNQFKSGPRFAMGSNGAGWTGFRSSPFY